MELGLAGKTVIVTGGGSNIGRAISLGFAREKSHVVIAEIDEAQAQKVAKEGIALGSKTIAIKTDITNTDSVEAMVKNTIKEFGQIDILINNVGWVPTKPFVDNTHEEMAKQLQLNYVGMVNCTRAVLDTMLEKRYGRIVSIASDAGRIGEANQAFYSGTKGAVIAFSKALAREVGRFNITLNCVAPGTTLPDNLEEAGKDSMWSGVTKETAVPPEVMQKIVKNYPLRRIGKPEDMVGAVLFISSDAASFITGQTLSVSGGYSMA